MAPTFLQLATATAAAALLLSPSSGFSLPRPRSASAASRCWTLLQSSNNNDNESSEAALLKQKASQMRREADSLRLKLELKKINELEAEVKEFASSDSGDARHSKKLDELRGRVLDFVRGSSVGKEKAEELLAGIAVLPSSATDTTNNSGNLNLPPQEIQSALSLIASLPKPAQETLAKLAGYSSYQSITNADEFVENLYKAKDTSTMSLRRTYANSFTDNPNAVVILSEEFEGKSIEEVTNILANKLEERIEVNRAMELFPRSLQDMESLLLPKEEDADLVFAALDQNTFMATERPIRVNGGYLIRGVNKRGSPSELIEALDKKITNEQFNERCQVNFVEITADPNSEEFIEDAILITSNKFPVRAPLPLGILATAISVFYTFIWGIDAFSGNQVVMQRLKEASELAQAASTGGVQYDLAWFNEMLLPLLGTLALVQGVHELGHLTVAWSNKVSLSFALQSLVLYTCVLHCAVLFWHSKLALLSTALSQIKLSAPIILPSKALPYLSFQNRLKTSPKDYTTLFDLAAAGPIPGLTVSFLALLYGLQLTTTVDPSTAQLLPSLPVGFLCQSSLGSTLVDLILGGGDGILINQEATAQIPLHPVAIAGFVGMMINALDLLPIGSTDGGRMSQAALGRVWHLTFSSVIFFLLIVASFVSDAQDIFLGYLFLYSFTQRDLEIPCRNEVDKADLPRVIFAAVSWLIAALILV
jgi:hypothetical protein